MADENFDPSFRAFAEARPKKREIWVRAYWGLWWVPVHIKAVLVALIPVAFAFGWGWLLTTLGLFSDPGFFLVPVLVVAALAAIMIIRHSERS